MAKPRPGRKSLWDAPEMMLQPQPDTLFNQTERNTISPPVQRSRTSARKARSRQGRRAVLAAARAA
eukprot:14321769-Alexandrium_andersonii.AAC.1